MKSAKWYFDFVSPFAYLQNLRLDEFSTHLKIDRKPLLFAGLLKHWDSKGPAELPPKRLFTYRHVQWMADRLDIGWCRKECCCLAQWSHHLLLEAIANGLRSAPRASMQPLSSRCPTRAPRTGRARRGRTRARAGPPRRASCCAGACAARRSRPAAAWAAPRSRARWCTRTRRSTAPRWTRT